MILFICSQAFAAPVEVSLDQAHRAYKNSGTIVLRDPFSDAVLGSYPFVTGGYGRGSTPFGDYAVGGFINDHHGPRWNLHAPGADDGEVWDARVKDTRTGIQLHRVRSDAGTLGCVGVVADKQRWQVFVGQLRYIKAWLGGVSFSLGTTHIEGPPYELVAHAVVVDGR